MSLSFGMFKVAFLVLSHFPDILSHGVHIARHGRDAHSGFKPMDTTRSPVPVFETLMFHSQP